MHPRGKCLSTPLSNNYEENKVMPLTSEDNHLDYGTNCGDDHGETSDLITLLPPNHSYQQYIHQMSGAAETDWGN